jgi:predicted Zn finger-like uncharacterized protein
MTVQCPHCSTQYRVPQAQISGPNQVFKCTKCEQLFESGERRRKSPSRTKKGDEPPNLSFDFNREEEDSTEQPAFVGGLIDSEDDDLEEGGDLEEDEFESEEDSEGDPEGPTDSDEDHDQSWVEEAFEDDAENEEDDEEDEDEEDEEWEDEPLPSRPSIRRNPVRTQRHSSGPTESPRKSPLRPVGWSVTVILLGYLLVAVTFDRRPEIALDTLNRIPVLGKLLGQDHLLAYRVKLEGIAGGLDHIKGNRLAYVVTGRAVNGTNENLRLIEIEGELIAGGKTRAVRKVYAANQAKGTIRDLSMSEVDMLLRLEPNRRFVIPPGKSASFLLVFPDPPADTSDVVCRVTEARTS